MKLAIINGPNLNLLGTREPDIYGSETFEDTLQRIKTEFPDDEFIYFQSNLEGEIIDLLQRISLYGNTRGIILNPGAYAHYSYAIADAIADCSVPVVEVHISNIHAREEFRAKSVTARNCAGIISGFGREGYFLAIDALKNAF